MKLPLYLLLLTGGSAFQCKQQPQQTTPTQVATTSQNTIATASPIDISQVPKASASKTAYLNTGTWHCVAASQPGSSDYQNGFQPTDLKFATDGGVEILKQGKSIGSGRWAFDDAQSLIYISSTLPELNSSWKVLDKGFRMVWLGNTAINQSGVQIRWDSYKEGKSE